MPIRRATALLDDIPYYPSLSIATGRMQAYTLAASLPFSILSMLPRLC